jgi:DNA-binding protein HU-alpha
MARSQTTASKTTSPKSTAPKTSASKTTVRKTAVAAAPANRSLRVPEPPVSSDAGTEQVQVNGPELKKQELIAKVLGKSDAKKNDVKPIVEAVLDVLGEALADGRELNLPPFGKLKVNRAKETANARIIVAKIRQGKSTGAKAGGKDDDGDMDPLAAAAE